MDHHHQNARLTIPSREQLARRVLELGVTLKLAAAGFNIGEKTAAKWVRRYREFGRALSATEGITAASPSPPPCPTRSTVQPLLFFHMARAHFSRFGVSVRRIFTDNGSCYRDWRFRKAVQAACLKHRFTRPYTPRTNGKAERFIQTALTEWAYARTYQTSLERHQQLDPWLHDYNFHRQHASLNHNTPAPRAGLNRNLLTLHS